MSGGRFRLRLRCRLRLRQRFGVGQVVAVGGWRLRFQFWVEDEVGVEVDREIGLEVLGGGMRCLRLRFSMVLRLRFRGCN